MSDRSEPVRCPFYLPGHNVHWIQVRLTWNEPQHDPIPAKLLEVRDDGELTLDVDGEPRVYWNHRPEDLVSSMDRYDGDFELVGYGVLMPAHRRRHVGEGFPAFYLAEPDSEYRHECRIEGSASDDPIQNLRKFGGFTMPAVDFKRWLD